MRGNGSNGSIAQQIAVSIVDNRDDSLAGSPLVQSPESARDMWISHVNSPGNNNTPINRSEDVSPVSRKDISSPTPSPQMETAATMEGAVANKSKCPTSPQHDQTAEDSTMEDDDETQLLAQLETERLAEEKAHKKRRELEERLAAARGKKPREINSNIMMERERDGGGLVLVCPKIVRPDFE